MIDQLTVCLAFAAIRDVNDLNGCISRSIIKYVCMNIRNQFIKKMINVIYKSCERLSPVNT